MVAAALASCSSEDGGTVDSEQSSSPAAPMPEPTSEASPTPSPKPTPEESGEPVTKDPIDEEETGSEPVDYGTPVRSERGNLVKALGQPSGVTNMDGEVIVDFAVTEIAVDIECTGTWAAEPENGHFVGLRFEIETHPILAEDVVPEFWIAASDFSAWDDNGHRANDVLGTAYSCLQASDTLPTMIGPGETADGWVVLDLPTDRGTVAFGWFGVYDLGWEWAYGD